MVNLLKRHTVALEGISNKFILELQNDELPPERVAQLQIQLSLATGGISAIKVIKADAKKMGLL